jgi:hypothetical protein
MRAFFIVVLVLICLALGAGWFVFLRGFNID